MVKQIGSKTIYKTQPSCVDRITI